MYSCEGIVSVTCSATACLSTIRGFLVVKLFPWFLVLIDPGRSHQISVRSNYARRYSTEYCMEFKVSQLYIYLVERVRREIK
jgi:hypothetical protein